MSRQYNVDIEYDAGNTIIDIIKQGIEKQFNVGVLDVSVVANNTFEVKYKCLVTGEVYKHRWEIQTAGRFENETTVIRNIG